MKINLDETDKQILEMMQEDAKINIKEIAAKLNMTKTPIYERIKRLEKAGVIDKYVTRYINFYFFFCLCRHDQRITYCSLI